MIHEKWSIHPVDSLISMVTSMVAICVCTICHTHSHIVCVYIHIIVHNLVYIYIIDNDMHISNYKLSIE